ncbi:MAG: phage major capsid protein, partial [Alteromonadales bacterium]|nr:phage major capsid protein [Alteromonadales bacterium]
TDEVLEFIASVKAGYRKNGKLMMNSQTELALRKIKDSNGQYLWEKSLQIGGPSSFDGKSILINESMPDLGAGKRFMGFGDMSYYTIADRGNMGILRMGEKYADFGQVGFRIDKRVDAKLTLPEAYKYMKNA